MLYKLDSIMDLHFVSHNTIFIVRFVHGSDNESRVFINLDLFLMFIFLLFAINCRTSTIHASAEVDKFNSVFAFGS